MSYFGLIDARMLRKYFYGIFLFNFSDEDESDTTTHEAVFSQRCIESYFRMNSMACLKKFDVPVNFANLAAANKVLDTYLFKVAKSHKVII